MKLFRVTSLWSIALFLVLAGHQTVAAQSTVMNIPSTDVEAAKKVYAEMDFLTNYAWQREGSFQTYVPRVVIGATHNIEAGVNVAFTHVAGVSEPIEVQPNIKWRFYNNEHTRTAASIGCIVYAPITNRAGANTLGLCYTVGSKRLNGRLGPRFSGGVYTIINGGSDNATHLGALAGYEQPLAKRLGFIVDWFSGDNRFGYVSPGLSIGTSSKSALTAGYAIANHGRGKNALFAYYGIQF